MKAIILAICIVVSFITTYSQESFRLEWEIEDNLMPLNAIVDNEGNTIVVGLIRKVNQNYDADGFIFKMTPEGEYSYYRYPSEPDTSVSFGEVIQIDNGNYFVFSSYGPNDHNNPNEKTMVCIFDQDLNLITKKIYELDTIYERISNQNLIVEDNGNILCAATISRKESNPMNKHDLALYRFAQNGDTIETKFRHFQRNVQVYDLDKIPESCNYLILEFITQLYGDFECYILKPDLSMDTVNFHNSFDYNVSGNKTCDYWYPDKTFLMASSMSFSDKSSDYGFGVLLCDTIANISDYLFLNKVDIYDNIAYRQCMAYADENSIYVSGYMSDYWDCDNPDSIELYVVDTALNQLAYKSLGGDISYDSWGVLTAKDKGAIIYGIAWHPEGENCYGNLVIYKVSREELGLPPVQVFDIEKQHNESKVYPNPATDIVNICFNKDLYQERTRIKLYNNSGKKIYDFQLPHNGNTLQLNIKNLEKGLYVYEITYKKQLLSKGKFIKQ